MITANNTNISLCSTKAATIVNTRAKTNTIDAIILVGFKQARSCLNGPIRKAVALTAKILPNVYGIAKLEG